MLETLEDRKTNWINYLKQVDIDERWKQKLCDEKVLGISTQVYLFYPELFWSVFSASSTESASAEDLDKLCIAGYLYFGSIILQDKLIDTNSIAEYENILQISWMQEESLHILHSIFPPWSSFWDLWVKRRNEYFGSVHLQKSSTSLSLKEYESLADGKAAFGKVAIDCCYSVLKHEVSQISHNKLIDSHSLFSIGNQLMDDLEDLDEDFRLGQINLALQWAKEQIQERGESYDVSDLNALKKYVYVSGIYEKILNLANDYLARALQEVQNLKGAERWVACILYKMKKITYRKNVFSIYTKELFVKTHYSTTRLDDSKDVSPSDCLQRALAFIFKQQDKTGCWTDMVTNAGFSNVWTTGYVLRNVSTFPGYAKEKSNAVKFLHDKKIHRSLWGYSDNWKLADGDSTTNVLMALLANDALIETDVKRWIETFRLDGGMSTYSNASVLTKALPEFKDFSGWTQSHDCVTALGLNFLSLMNGTFADQQYYTLKYMLLDRYNHHNVWDGYWWTSPLYTTCHILQALIVKEWEKEESRIKKTLDSILQKANANGSFSTPYDTESPFFTSLVLDTICSAEPVYNLYREEAHAMSQWLIQNQFTDGSFNSGHILRIPAPHIESPGEIENWSTEANIPVNVVKKDIMRLYTTSTVCSAMMKYNRFLI
jgi:A-macroglobulin TED domain